MLRPALASQGCGCNGGGAGAGAGAGRASPACSAAPTDGTSPPTHPQFVADYVGGEYEDRLRQAKFCLAPYGHGFGMRLVQAALAGCVPVIVQEHVVQAFEDVLPYETFSVRLSNDDLPRIREILRGVTPEQYRGMLHALGAHRGAFFWQPDMGGKAFDYTIASLRRRYLNLKAEHF